MITIEVTSEHPLTVPAPVRIAVPGEKLPAGPLALRDARDGRTVPAQREGEGAVVALLGPLPERARRRFTLQAAPAELPGVQLRPAADHRLEVVLGDQLFTVYSHDPLLPRPFFYPLYGPGQRPVTRAFPMRRDVPNETRDHPHHRSFWTSYGEVNGADLWSEAAGRHGWIQQQDLRDQVSGPVFGGFTADCVWATPDKRPILSETRTIRIYNAGEERRLFDYGVTFAATEGDVRFGDTKEGGIIAFRVATSMDGNKGGKIENANGEVGEKQCWGKRAPWCDYSGPTDGAVLGIAVMDNPASFRHPPHWHVRDYGLFTTNVFGASSFAGQPGKRGEYVLKRGERISFRYRVLIHKGDAEEGFVADVYHGYIQPPAGKVAG